MDSNRGGGGDRAEAEMYRWLGGGRRAGPLRFLGCGKSARASSSRGLKMSTFSSGAGSVAVGGRRSDRFMNKDNQMNSSKARVAG